VDRCNSTVSIPTMILFVIPREPEGPSTPLRAPLRPFITRTNFADKVFCQFGAGAGTCIGNGKSISIMEMGKLVPQILWQFELRWVSRQAHWRVKTYWFWYQDELMVRMKPQRSMSRDTGDS